MGVLKRFSYDNIVIHDPTAPDPVDYDGGGEGGGGSSGSWKYNVVLDVETSYVYLKDSAGNDVSYDQFKNDIATVAVFEDSETSEIGETFIFYTFMYLTAIEDDSREVSFLWPAQGYNTFVHFEDIDGKLRAQMPG